MIYQEKFNLDHNSADYFSNEIDVIICGLRNEIDKDERFNHIKNSLSKFSGKIIYFNTDEDANSLIYEIRSANNDILDKQEGLSLIPDLRKFLKQFKANENAICLDITCLPQPILFLLIKILISEVKPKKLFAAYTEPKKYKKNQQQIIEDEEFMLYDKIIGCNYSVPGFSKINREEKEMLVAPFGFERQRLISIYESVEPRGGLIPILGFPSFVPGWNLTALYMNYKVIADSQAEQQIRYCEASSPFGLFHLLQNLLDLYGHEYKILIAPLGTRPHSLGAALFATKHKECHLIYDFPVEKVFRSENILKANIYNLTSFID